MQWEDLISLYNNSEDTCELVFISSDNQYDDILPTLVALANTKGGILVIGVDFKNYHLHGTELTSDTLTRLIGEYCEPRFSSQCHTINRNDKTILALTVPESHSKPHTCAEKCYVRDNAITRLATEEEETKLLEDSVNPKDVSPEPSQKTYMHSTFHLNKPSIPTLPRTPFPSSTNTTPQHNIAGTDDITTPSPSLHDRLTPRMDEPNSQKLPKASFSSEPATLLRPNDDLLKQYRAHLNKRQRKALSYLRKNKKIRNKQYRNMGQVSHKTAHLELVEMVQYDLIRPQGAGRSTHYTLSPTIMIGVN